MERFLAALCSRTDAVVEAARRLLEDERAPRRQRLLADLIHNLSGDSAAERRDEDGKWFEGMCFLVLAWSRLGPAAPCTDKSLAVLLPHPSDIDEHRSRPRLAFPRLNRPVVLSLSLPGDAPGPHISAALCWASQSAQSTQNWAQCSTYKEHNNAV